MEFYINKLVDSFQCGKIENGGKGAEGATEDSPIRRCTRYQLVGLNGGANVKWQDEHSQVNGEAFKVT